LKISLKKLKKRNDLVASMGRHQRKLMAAVSGLENGEVETGVAPQQVKSARMR
jgi:hypothetical protein